MNNNSSLAVPARPPDPHTKSLLEAAELYLENSTSENTRRAYEQDQKHFEAWCSRQGIKQVFPTDHQTLLVYMAWQAQTGSAYATIRRRLATLSVMHEAQGYPSPTKNAIVRQQLEGIARAIGKRQDSAEAINLDELCKMLLHMPDNLLGKRDRALFMVGIAGAFRRSELVAINVGDVEFVKEGMRILLRQSKTDQTQKGMIVDIDYGNFGHTCPVKALRAWLEAAGLERGAVFRKIAKGYTRDHVKGRLNSDGVSRIVKRYMHSAKIERKRFSAHSFRATFAAILAGNNVDSLEIQTLGRWRDLDTMRGYVKRGKEFKSQRSKRLGF